MSVRSWILGLGLYTAGWLALMLKFLVDNFDRSFRWIGAWRSPAWVVFLAGAVGPLLAVVVLLAGPVGPRISEEAKKRSTRRVGIFLLTTIVAAISLPLASHLELGRFGTFGACLLAGWVVLTAPWVGLHVRWFTDDPRGSF